MRLYHFTSPLHVHGCRARGIIYGTVPVNDRPVQLLRGYQWLTANPEKAQSWNGGSSLPYDRTAYRLTVTIPKTHRRQLVRWLDRCNRLSRIADVLNAYGDPENWWLFKGAVRPEWITETVDMRVAHVAK